jgi:NADH-quinone oxidoreductase subunit I
MEQPPHPMRLGDNEGDYYRGTFKSPTVDSAVEKSEEASS